MGKHAILSASSSHRWLACPPSARLCADKQDKGSEYAQQGTDAHSLCEHKLKLALEMDTTDPTPELTYYDQEMEDCATEYAGYVMSIVAAVRQSFRAWQEAAGGFGDCSEETGSGLMFENHSQDTRYTGPLADAQAISGIEYDISSYADVVDAIHVIQTSMDITGTTAKEASDTISGSISSMQSALQNLVVGFGRADADIEALCDNVVDAFKTVLKNITPVIENIVKALPAVSDALLTAVAELLPTLLDTVTDLFSQILTTILELLPNLIPATVEAVLTIVTAIVDNLPLLIDAAVQLVMALVSGIGEALPELIPAAVNAVVTIVQGLVENLPMILDAALQLVLGLAQGILNAIPVLIEALPEIITAMLDFFSGATPQIVEAGIQLLTSLITALPEIIGAIVEAMPQIIDGLLNALLAGIPQVIDAGVKLLIALVEDLPYIIDTVIKAVPEIVSSIVDAFWERRGEIVEIGKNLVKGLWDGIQQLAGWLWNKVSDWISSIWDGICDFFGIHSPSREMAWIGEMLVKGLSGSIDDNGSEAVSAAQGMADDINSVFNDLAADMTLPTNFDFDANANLSASVAGGVQAMGSGPLFTVQQMVVRSEDDIRRVSQDLYDMIQTGSRAQGRFVIA